MTHILKALVGETSTTTGTGALTLAAALTDHRRFSVVCATSDTTEYMIRHATDGTWEAGIGTYSAANTLTRTSVSESSNANAAVSFAAGTKNVVLTPLASRLAVNPMWERVSAATVTTTTAYLAFTGLQAGYAYRFESQGLVTAYGPIQFEMYPSHDNGATWIDSTSAAWETLIEAFASSAAICSLSSATGMACLGVADATAALSTGFAVETPELGNSHAKGIFYAESGILLESTDTFHLPRAYGQYVNSASPINAVKFDCGQDLSSGTIICYRRAVT